MASIYILGIIQDALEPDQFSLDDATQLWGCMLNNICPDNVELTKIAAKAITRLAPGSKQFFEDANLRTAIMEGIFKLLEFQDEEVLQSALEALIDISQLNYPLMGEFLPRLLLVTKKLLQGQTEDVAQFSIEVWTSLLEAECDNLQNPLE